jgi:hypothetical protein
MVEYIYDAIKATANTETQIAAIITGDDNAAITEGCSLMLFNDEELLVTAEGYYYEDTWFFTIPAEVTAKFHGRYWYCIFDEVNHRNLSFKQPIYFV